MTVNVIANHTFTLLEVGKLDFRGCQAILEVKGEKEVTLVANR